MFVENLIFPGPVLVIIDRNKISVLVVAVIVVKVNLCCSNKQP